jgi:hypothetical protein
LCACAGAAITKVASAAAIKTLFIALSLYSA